MKRIVLNYTIVTLLMLIGVSSVQAAKTFTAGDTQVNNLRADYYGWFRTMDLIEERSNGEITFKRLGKSMMGTDVAMFEAVQKGTLDMASGWATIATNHSKAAGALLLPFLFNLPEDMLWVLSAPEARELLDVVGEEAGVYILTTGIYEERHFFNSKRPIKNIEDVKGLRLRTMASKDEQEWVAMTGAIPGPSAFPELYMMLKTGVFDGCDSNFTLHDAMKYYEVLKYATVIGYHYLVPMTIISKKAWSSLSEDEQKLFKESAHQAMVENYAQSRRMVQRARAIAMENGTEIVEELEDREKWVEAVKPHWEKIMAESAAAKKFVEAVQSYHEKYPRWPIDSKNPVPSAK